MHTQPRLYRVTAQRIEHYIARERIAPGMRLPSERALAVALHISRASLREGLVALELDGTIAVRGCSGAYVCEPPALPGRVPEACDVLSARRLVETEVAALATRNANAAVLDAILAALLAMERAGEDRFGNEAAERDFHLALTRASGNAALLGVVGYLWNQYSGLCRLLRQQYRIEDLHNTTLAEHRAIFNAIAAGNEDGARLAMRTHLARVTRTLSGV